MYKFAASIVTALMLISAPVGVANAQNVVDEALKGCSKEIKTYCSSVTPGGGRLVSCARAHRDKLSSECVYAINRAGYWLSYLARTLNYVVSQCKADALKYCPKIKLGEERVLNCLSANKPKLNKYCGLALKDIGRK